MWPVATRPACAARWSVTVWSKAKYARPTSNTRVSLPWAVALCPTTSSMLGSSAQRNSAKSADSAFCRLTTPAGAASIA